MRTKLASELVPGDAVREGAGRFLRILTVAHVHGLVEASTSKGFRRWAPDDEVAVTSGAKAVSP